MTGRCTRWERWLPGSGGRLKMLNWNLHSFKLLEIIQVLDSISWVRCASGNVYLYWRNEGKFDISGQTRPASYAASWEAQSPGESDRKIKDQNPSRFHRQQLTRIWEVMAHKQVIQCSRNMLGNYIFCPFFSSG